MTENPNDAAQNSTFFYIIDGKKEGPVSRDDLINLKKRNVISATTLIWTKSYASDWKEFSKVNELRDDDEPPPIPSQLIPMRWLLLLIMAPIILMIVELILTESDIGINENNILIVYWATNSFVAFMDQRTLKKSNHLENHSRLIFWALFFVPVYIFIRGRRTGCNLWPFIAWIFLFTVSVVAIEPLRSSMFFGFGLPTCESSASQSQIKSLYSEVGITFGAKVIKMNDIREVSSQGTQSRACTAVILDSKTNKNRVNYTITEDGEQFYYEVHVSKF